MLNEFKNWLLVDDICSLNPYDDNDFLRFCRARHFKLDEVKTMFGNFIDWRKAEGVDTIFEDFHFHEADIIAKLYPCGYHKVSKDGGSVYLECLGALDVDRIVEETTFERLLKNLI